MTEVTKESLKSQFQFDESLKSCDTVSFLVKLALILAVLWWVQFLLDTKRISEKKTIYYMNIIFNINFIGLF